MSGLFSDLSALTDEDRGHPAYPSFVENLRGRAWGPEAVHAGWHMFAAGWDSKTEDTRDQDEAAE